MFNKLIVIFAIAVLLASFQALAESITPQLGGGIGSSFDGGIGGRKSSGGGGGGGCASPTAPNGVVDLSQCSNAFYAAVIF